MREKEYNRPTQRLPDLRIGTRVCVAVVEPLPLSSSSSLPNGSSKSGRVIQSRARGASFFSSVLLALRFVRSGILRGRYRDLSSSVICLIPARTSPYIA
ncbi:unnamed protein product [Musa textilis]